MRRVRGYNDPELTHSIPVSMKEQASSFQSCSTCKAMLLDDAKHTKVARRRAEVSRRKRLQGWPKIWNDVTSENVGVCPLSSAGNCNCMSLNITPSLTSCNDLLDRPSDAHVLKANERRLTLLEEASLPQRMLCGSPTLAYTSTTTRACVDPASLPPYPCADPSKPACRSSS